MQAANCSLLDHFVGEREQCRRDRETKCSGSLEIDRQFEFGRLLDRKIGRFGAFQNPVDVPGGALAQGKYVRPKGQEPPGLDEFSRLMHRG